MWKILLRIESKHAQVYASSLTPEETVMVSNQTAEISLQEPRAKDLRAMWNTRLRSLVVSQAVIEVMDS